MAHHRKYQGLPDLDSAPDIYETPDLTDDNSTLPTGTLRSHSSASSYKDFDDDDAESTSISRSRLHPDEARSHFSPAQIDARDVDFSDRVNGKRKSYRASSRRQQKREDGTEVLGDLSDEEDGENLERKLARLRREIEEVKEEVGKRNYEKQKADDGTTGDADGVVGESEAVSLSRLLDSIHVGHGGTRVSAGARLARSIASNINGPDHTQIANAPNTGGEATTYTVTYAPDYQQSHTLARAADFDSRLSLLEKALGITSSAIPALDSKGIPLAVLPTLDRLQRQMSIITEASPSSLDAISRRVRTLTQEAERLEEARKSAQAAQEEALSGTNGEVPARTAAEGQTGGDSEQVAKINALYGTLGTIEQLAPMLPSLLDRLRSLRAIHADAATASADMDRVARRQEDMAADIKKWREGLEKVERAMNQTETVLGGNMKVVQGWVKDLEERMARF